MGYEYSYNSFRCNRCRGVSAVIHGSHKWWSVINGDHSRGNGAGRSPFSNRFLPFTGRRKSHS